MTLKKRDKEDLITLVTVILANGFVWLLIVAGCGR